jgi:hypothetical protein
MSDADTGADVTAPPRPRRRHNQLSYRGRLTNRLPVYPKRRANQRPYRSLTVLVAPLPGEAGAPCAR